MSQSTGNVRCTVNCYLIGLVAGVLAAIMLVLIGSFSWPGAIFTGIVAAIAVGLFLSWTICRPLPTFDEVQSRRRAGAANAGTHVVTAATPAAVAAMPASESPASSGASDDGTVAVAGMHDHASPAPEPTEADKPNLLSGPRDGSADDLKMIKGVGPKLEQMLHDMGVYHFDQVAGWTEREVAWVDANLEGFKGRVSRDDWVSQAKVLAEGGDTAFSRKVEGGDVY